MPDLGFNVLFKGKNMARLIEAFIADNGADETECGCAHCMAEFGGFKL